MGYVALSLLPRPVLPWLDWNGYRLHVFRHAAPSDPADVTLLPLATPKRQDRPHRVLLS